MVEGSGEVCGVRSGRETSAGASSEQKSARRTAEGIMDRRKVRVVNGDSNLGDIIFS
jgi:hypothetical protein